MDKPLTEIEKQEWIKKIQEMTQIEMARVWRFSKAGHPVFDTRNQPLYDTFCARFFVELGGFTPEISKAIG